MKTIKKWLEELPEPYRTQALDNLSEEDGLIESETMEYAIRAAFVWFHTEEGHTYWSNLRKSYLEC